MNDTKKNEMILLFFFFGFLLFLLFLYKNLIKIKKKFI